MRRRIHMKIKMCKSIPMKQLYNIVSLMGVSLLIVGVGISRAPDAAAQDATQMHYFNLGKNLLEEKEANRLKGNYQEICSIATDFNRAMRQYPGAKGFTSILTGWRLFYYSMQEFNVLTAKMKAMCPSGYYFK